MQIQAAFGDLPLAELGLLGLRIYLQIPDFRDRCPLCGGADCAVRHGLYYRPVVETDGSVIERFPIPRFRCRHRGRRQPEAATFSVLPAALVPRQRFSLPLMLLILDLVRRRTSTPEVLDRLAAIDRGSRGALLVEETTIHRVLVRFARAYLGLGEEAIHVMHLRPDPGGTRGRALALAEILVAGRDPPDGSLAPVLRFHRRFFPHMLLDVHTH